MATRDLSGSNPVLILSLSLSEWLLFVFSSVCFYLCIYTFRAQSYDCISKQTDSAIYQNQYLLLYSKSRAKESNTLRLSFLLCNHELYTYPPSRCILVFCHKVSATVTFRWKFLDSPSREGILASHKIFFQDILYLEDYRTCLYLHQLKNDNFCPLYICQTFLNILQVSIYFTFDFLFKFLTALVSASPNTANESRITLSFQIQPHINL